MNKAITSILWCDWWICRTAVKVMCTLLIISLMEGSVILKTGYMSHNKCCPGKDGNVRKFKTGSCNAN